jgi:hypothetical protein
MQREFKLVAVRDLNPSTVLPPREHSPEISESVKKIGVQQPPIVRPIAGKPGEYEIIDGHIRVDKLKPDDQILVDIRYDVNDLELVKISAASFLRKERTAYEVSQFLAAGLKTLEKEEGAVEVKGLHQKLANLANLGESSLSQFLAIAGLFQKLQELAPQEQFSNLRTWSINKLFKLSTLVDDPSVLDVAQQFDLKSEVQMEDVENVVNDYKEREMEALEAQIRSGLEPEQSQMAPEPFSATSSDCSKRICLKNAKKVGSLVSETHETLNAAVQQLTQDADRFSTTEILQTLTKVLRTLRRLKKHSSVLKQKMNLS